MDMDLLRERLIVGRFRVDIFPGWLLVTREDSISNSTPLRIFASRCACFFILASSAIAIVALIRWFYPFGIALFLGLVFCIFDHDYNLRCDSTRLQIADLLLGMVVRVRSYARTQVTCLRYGMIAVSKPTTSYGLLLEVPSAQFEILRGLGNEDARRVMDALERLGYNVDRSSPTLPQ